MTACSLAGTSGLAQPARRPRILVRSSWQVVNIGDIAHTPGILALLEEHIPNAELMLWSSGDLTAEVEQLLRQRFPKLVIVKGRISQSGEASTPELAEAISRCDFLLHGSGASFVAARDVKAFVASTGKPYGIYGITYSGADQTVRDLMSQARFIFFRDSVSLEKAKSDGITSPIMQFGPDAAFATDLRNDEAADAFLAGQGLEAGQFVCCIPRLRYTPYWLIRDAEFNANRHARNEEMKEHDHAPLRAAITAVVAETDLKVLICPEDQTQMAVGREMLFDRLPDEVRDRVVWRENFWLTDEALSTYIRSAGLFGLEMHSPIMCIGNGVPALVGRFAEQTSKGFMWRDIGLDDWLFDFDKPEEVDRLTPTLLSIITDREAALARVQQAHEFVKAKQAETMTIVAEQLM